MWLLKTEPGDYSWEQLQKAGRARWDGVRNPAALRNLAAMKPGDRVLVYHTGDEKAVVGLAEVVRAHGERPAVEQLFEEGNQEVGLNHYEVRSWTG